VIRSARNTQRVTLDCYEWSHRTVPDRLLRAVTSSACIRRRDCRLFRGAILIVMGLHSSELLGFRMGSVTDRVVALTRTLVLAVPPTLDAAAA
jgi:nucleotide-binding universal stress UspA family protein